MIVPQAVLDAVQPVVEGHTVGGGRIVSAASVGGGCINPSARLRTEGGEDYFLKWNRSAPSDMFELEALGLKALGSPKALRVPEVVGWGGRCTTADPGWLLLEFIPSGRPNADYGTQLGRGLGTLHTYLPPASEAESLVFGWERDNYIGSLPQSNTPHEDWTTFWREERLEPQIAMARDRGYFSGGRGRVLDRLLDALDDVMAGAAERGPGLIHGDLWSGNLYPDLDGRPVLIDPAAYHGVGEVDLAMMELFGHLPRGFREGYEDAGGVPEEYDAFRRDLYQLYYLLVHVNLFGGGYEQGSLGAAERALSGA